MTFGVRVHDRAGAAVLPPADVTFTPTAWSSAAVGGPVAAEIELTGNPDAMLPLAAWLGYRLAVLADEQEVWWGHLESLTVTAGRLTRTVTLEGMANRVKVLYSQARAGGEVIGSETDWTEDAASIVAYGKRELVYSAPSTLTETQALALRGRLLATLARPQKRLTMGAGGAAGRLACRGEWRRLDDVYYAQVAGLEAYTPNGSGEVIPLGMGFSSAYLGFGGSDSAKRIHAIDGQFLVWSYAGWKVVVSGTSANNGVKTLAGADRKPVMTRTAATISFEPADDIRDSGNGLTDLAVDDVIWVSGAATGSNNGAKLIKSPGAGHIEISPGWSGGDIVTGAAGPTVTIKRGNSVTVEEAVTNERPNGSNVETVTAYGQKVYQTFTLATATAWTLAKVEIRARRVGNPADNLRVALYTDSAGAPGTLVEAVTVAGSALADVMDWVEFVFANTATLNYGTTYGLLIERTGAMAPADFYEVAFDPDGAYARGAMKLHDGTTHQTAAGDLIFRCLGAQDTALQIRDVVQGAGVELAGVLVQTQSGLATVQYQAGDETALAIVDGLLAQGVSSGARLLATMTPQRWVQVMAQTPASERLLVWRNGALHYAQGGRTPEGWLPVGAWVHLDDVLLTDAWAGLSPVFVERATYRVKQGLALDAEYQRSPADLLGVQQG